MREAVTEEIRAEAIERVAQADFAYTEKFMGRTREWDAAAESEREFHREIATVAVDALGDVLPTGVEQSAAEVLALRARVTEAEEARDIAEGQWRLSCGEANAARDRVAELEAERDLWKERAEKGQLHRDDLIKELIQLRARVADLEAELLELQEMRDH